MSQYPSPYTPPHLDYSSPPVPGGPQTPPLARKVAILLLVLGVIGVALGLCAGSVMWKIPSEQMPRYVDQLARMKVVAPAGVSPEQFVRIYFATIAIFFAGVGAVLIVMSLFVRRTSKWATVAAMVLCGLVTMIVALNVLSAARFGLAGDAMALMGGCFALVPLSLFGLATLWLMQLLRALPGIQAARRQYQLQYMQSQQQQQIYNGNQSGATAGYGGYGGSPPPGSPSQAPGVPSSGQGYAMPPQPGPIVPPNPSPPPARAPRDSN